jgi:signal transduction histidine kinase/ligand-binding sensor domain-containing protein
MVPNCSRLLSVLFKRSASGFYVRVAVLALMFATAALSSSFSAVPNYLVRGWQAEEGLPQNKVTAVVQTQDGYLWVGTYSGLARFDGMRFAVFDDKNTPEMHSSRVTSLFESGDGTLWIGHENGEVTTCKDGKFQPVEIHVAGISRKICAFTADTAGDVWLLNEAGLLVRVSDGLVLSPQTGIAAKLLNLARSTDGTIWVARDGQLSALDHGQLRIFEDDGSITNTYVQGICAGRDGGLWISNNGRIRKWKDGGWIQDLGPAPWEMTALTSLMETKDGALLAATSSSGFFILFPGTEEKPLHFSHANGFQADWILSLMEDREGNLWVGTGGAGLISLRRNLIQTLSPPDHWRGRAVLSVCPGSAGGLWVGTEGAGLYHFQDGGWNNFGYTNGIGNSYVWSIAEDAAGNLWVGTWGAGLFLREGNRFRFAPGMENMMLPIPALLPARDGGLWAGTAAGLLRYQAGRTNWFTESDGKSLRDVRTIAEDAKGAVWFGTAGNGLGCLEQGRIRQFRQTNGLSSDFVECLHFDEEGALWIGTFGGGLCRLKQGHFSVIDRQQGLPNSVIGDIEDDGNGFFWMSSHSGIIRASKAELNDCADGKIREVRCMIYGVNDGLPTIECSEGMQPAGCKTPDGRLWFPTSKGLVLVNPNEVNSNPLPPPMVLEELLADGHLVTNTASPLRIPPGHNRFEFHYTGLSFAAPEKVRFKYRIEGLEEEWVDAGTKRVANYSFIPPGDYTFHVIGCNNDGVWNKIGAAVAFRVLPYFWQTLWFRVFIGVAAVAASGGIVWFDTRRRMRRKLERIERQREIEQERARIAHDIHDDLGAQLTRITMLSESAHGELDDPKQAADDLNDIYDTAREATKAMDEIVWAVNPKHDSLESLASYLEKFAIDFLRAANTRCRLDMPSRFPAWHLTSEARHNLFLAYKEALNNVAKHAGASEVRITLTLEESAFELDIEDNGRGFDPQNFKTNSTNGTERLATGNGLESMDRRVRDIGGRCEIRSAPGDGTKVKFQLTLKLPQS